MTYVLTDNEVHEFLDHVSAGDNIEVIRTNSARTLDSVVYGPALAAPGMDLSVGIDLLDGEPHVVRRKGGQIFGDFVYLSNHTKSMFVGELI